jgi:hypothetical protein
MNIPVRFECSLTRFLIPLMLLITACESDLNLEISDSSLQLTVNCILKDDEPVSMKITESLPYQLSSDTSRIVRNAFVRLTDEDGFKDTLVYREYKVNNHVTGAYVSLDDYKPVSDNTYQIRVEVPGFEEITSVTVTPRPVPILWVDTNTTYIKNGSNNYKVLECVIRFEDPAQVKNFYKLSIDRFGLAENSFSAPFGGKTDIVKYRASFFCPDNNAVCRRIDFDPPGFISLEDEDEDEEIWVNDVFIADNSFNGNIYELKVFIRMDWFYDRAYPPAGENITNRTAYIRLYSVNEEYYKYSRSYFNQLIKRNDMFSEPVQVYSNILNGTGIFSGASASIDSSIIIPVSYNSPIN